MWILFVLLIFLLYLQVEPFQSFKSDDEYIPYSFVPITKPKKQIMLTVPSLDRDQCTKLCTDTPRCVGFNYNQNTCTLYKGNVDDFIVYGAYRRYW